MAYPPLAQLQTNFTAFATGQGDNSFPGSSLDNELANLKISVDALNQWVRRITRSDGELGNLTVGVEQLKPGLTLGVESPAEWAAATAYTAGKTVFAELAFHMCAVAHTSTSFAADLSAGYWVTLVDFEPFINDYVAGIDASYPAQVVSLLALTALEPATGRAALLKDSLRAGQWVWDATVTPTQYEADEYEMAYAAPVPGEYGAWVSPYADPRLGLWADSATPGVFGRFKSGLRLGDSVLHRGATAGNNGATNSWMASVGGNPSTWSYMEDTATFVSSRTGQGVAVTGAGRLISAQGGAAIGLIGVALNDSTVSSAKAWGGYFEAVLGPNGTGRAIGIEVDAANDTGVDIPFSSPYAGAATLAVAVLNLGAGADASVHGATSAISQFLGMGNNGARASAGILMKHTALVREGDATTGLARALVLAQNQAICWYGAVDGLEAARFTSELGGQSVGQDLAFTATGLEHRTRAGAILFKVSRVGASVNYPEIKAAATGSPVEVSALGSDTNIDLRLNPKGTGVLRVGYETTVATTPGNFSAGRYLEFKDANGTTLYIPCRTTTW